MTRPFDVSAPRGSNRPPTCSEVSREGTWMMHVYKALINYEDLIPPQTSASPPRKTPKSPNIIPTSSCSRPICSRRGATPNRRPIGPRVSELLNESPDECDITFKREESYPLSDARQPSPMDATPDPCQSKDGADIVHILTIPKRKRRPADGSQQSHGKKSRPSPDYESSSDASDVKREALNTTESSA